MAGNAAIHWRPLPLPPAQPSSLTPEEILRTLAESDALAHLLREASHDGRLTVVVNDPERATQTRPVLEGLAALALERKTRFTVQIVVATGTHRIRRGEQAAFEARMLLVPGLHVEGIAWHDADDERNLLNVGNHRLQRAVASARCLLGIGSVEPHYFAGLTGAHKTLTIGVMSRKGIEQNHFHALSPHADLLRLDGNPVFDGIAATCDALTAQHSTLAINQIVFDGRITRLTVNEPLAAVRALADDVRRLFIREIDAPCDLLHLRVPPPLGRSLYQADKAFKNNGRAVRDGGVIILEAPLLDGVGPDKFINLLQVAPSYAAAVNHVDRHGYRLGDHKAVRLRDLTDAARRGVHLAVVSSLDTIPSEVAAALPATAFTVPDEAFAWAVQQLPPGPVTGLRIDDAGHVCCLPAETDSPVA